MSTAPPAQREPDELIEAQAAEYGPPSGPTADIPEAPVAEEQVLSAMLLSVEAVETAAAAGLIPEHLSRPGNRKMHEAILAVVAGGARLVTAEMLTAVAPGLFASAGGPDRFRDLLAVGSTVLDAGVYAAQIVEARRSLRLAVAGEELTKAVLFGDTHGRARALDQIDAARAVTRTTDRLPGYTMADLLDLDLTLKWMVRGILTDPTYGQIAGELKTLKSHLATILAVAVASGRPYLDRFTVDEAQPVTVLVGEGGRVPFTRRLLAITQAMGIDDPRDLPIRSVYEVAPIGTDRFKATIHDELDLGARLILLDPLYAYHGTDTNSANLHEEGSLLTSLSNPCTEAGASLMIVNHFNQTGSGSGLKRITQAGSGEWVDSWMLTRHRQDPDVPNGDFYLELDTGSRQWGGSKWEIDMHLGRLDPTTGHHEGDISWETRPASATARETDNNEERRQRILDAVAERPGQLIQEDLAKTAGGNLAAARKLVKSLETDGQIVGRNTTRTRTDGRDTKSWCFHPTSDFRTPQDAGATT